MEFIFISPRLMSLRHKDEAFLHIPFPIPYILLHSISSEPALLLRLSLLLVLLLGEGTKKRKPGTSTFILWASVHSIRIYGIMPVSFHFAYVVVYAKYCQAATRRTTAAFHVIEPTPSMLNKSQQDGLGSIDWKQDREFIMHDVDVEWIEFTSLVKLY